jgi:hypothetical protein
VSGSTDYAVPVQSNFNKAIIIIIIIIIMGSVGIATRYGMDSPGIESRWGDIFRALPDRPLDSPSLLYIGYRIFPGGKAAGV